MSAWILLLRNRGVFLGFSKIVYILSAAFTLIKEPQEILVTSEINESSFTFPGNRLSERQSEWKGTNIARDKNPKVVRYHATKDTRKSHYLVRSSESSTKEDNDVYSEHSEFLDKLFKNYDYRIRPFFRGPPVIVNCDMFIESIDSIDANKMSYGLLLFMRQRWRDPRLAYEQYETVHNDSVINLHPKFLKKMWVPDLFYPNEKIAKFHSITTENKLIRLYPTGDIWYSVRLSLTLQVSLHLQDFPLDMQTCIVQLESYAFTTNDVIFKWKKEDPVQINELLTLPQFTLIKYNFGNCTKIYNTGEYTCVEVRFTLLRQIGYYVIRSIVPSILVVALSWVGFWIHAESAPARVALGITTVLTITTMSSNLGETVPKVSYVRAIDIWHFACLMFVFAALIEYAIENFLCNERYRRLRKAIRHKTPKEIYKSCENGYCLKEGSEYDEMMNFMSYKNNYKTDYSNGFLKANASDNPELHQKQKSHKSFYYPGKIDKLSQIFFPLSFLVFSAIYFAYYIDRYYGNFN